MSIFKNSFGVCIEFNPKISPINFLNKMAGSSLERKQKQPFVISEMMSQFVTEEHPTKEKKIIKEMKYRTMSSRTKTKIKKKIIAFLRLRKKLSFVTLTFVNIVTDRQAIKILKAFLDNVKKRNKGFEYLWVIERQTKNIVFENNPHFHLITNKYWEIERWKKYWVEIQSKHNIIPRNESYNPSSSFDVKFVNANNIKAYGNYLTKYVTKNVGKFQCMLWNCSKKISQLYTDFYSDDSILKQFERLKDADKEGELIKIFKHEYFTLYGVPYNNITTRFYDKIDEKNKRVWNKN